jgi:hypothetical protein
MNACFGASPQENARYRAGINTCVQRAAWSAPLAAATALGLAVLSLGATAVSAQEVLTLHNAKRSVHCAPSLTWSPTLAAAAQVWANRCQFVHSPPESRPGQGENLAWGSGSFASATSSVERWYAEVSKYSFASPGFSPATGHFTQVVWRGSQQLGCGVASCGGQSFWVCRYSPAGNITNPGQFAQNVLPATCSSNRPVWSCRWFGTPPFCAGHCPAGYLRIGASYASCAKGFRVHCCRHMLRTP